MEIGIENTNSGIKESKENINNGNNRVSLGNNSNKDTYNNKKIEKKSIYYKIFKVHKK